MEHIHTDFFAEPQFQMHRTFWTRQFEQAAAPLSLASRLLFADAAGATATDVPLTGVGRRVLEHIGRGTKEGSFALVAAAVVLLLARLTDEESVILELPAAASQAAHERPFLVVTTKPERPVKELLLAVGDALPACAAYRNFPINSFRDQIGSLAGSDVFIASEDLHGPVQGAATHTLSVHFRSEPEPSLVLTSPSGRLPGWFLAELGAILSSVLAAFAAPNERQAAVLELAFEGLAARIRGFNRTERDFGPSATVLDLFERRVAEQGADVAVIVGDDRFDYEWLDTQSRRLAAYLQSVHGAGPGTLIASLQNRSQLAVVSALGILRSGAALLPLSPNLPPERLAGILEESEAAALLLHSSHLELAIGHTDLPLFATDLQLADLPDAERLGSRPRSEDLAYVIYTSGTTGAPKGVMVPHGGLANTVLDHVERFGVDRHDRYIQFMATSFDGFLLDVFTALAAGGTLIIADDETIANPVSFMDEFERHGATMSTLTPSYLQLLDPDRVGKMRLLVSAGEALPAPLARRYAPRLALYNGYGPTEASINTTLHLVAAEASSDSIPIGRPSANKQVYVVDRLGRLAPPGVVGEICISGTGLAIGYLGDQALTAEKFIDNPFASGTRLYRSGDRGAWTQDGNLLFQGRSDSQVKINGLRIDLAEIDRTMNGVCDLRASQVLVHETASGRKELLAFYQRIGGMELVPSLGEYGVYDPFVYESMATDDIRVNAYRRGLAGRVRGKVVLDPGTGSEVALARHCIDAGAARVYAIELDDDAAHAAAETIRQLGLEHDIVLVHGDAAELGELPEPVDAVVSALAGNIASSDGCIPLVNAIKRHLPRNVAFIPGRYVTRIAGFQLPVRQVEAGFSDISKHYLQEIFARSGKPFDVRLCLRNMDHDLVLTNAGEAEDIDYGSELYPEESRDLRLDVTRDGDLTGFVLWLEAYVDDELLLDSSRQTHHLPVYMPLRSGTEIKVTAGDEISMRFVRSLGEDGRHPDYAIEGAVRRRGALACDFAVLSPHGSVTFRDAALYRSLFAENGLPRPGRRSSGSVLRGRLAERLPSYMLPHRLIEVKSWPLTPHGKVDTAALAHLAEAAVSTDANGPEPEDAIEHALCRIWAEVLETPRVGVEDNLFGLGCDSIRVIQAVHLAREQGLNFNAADVAARQTIRSLAALLRASGDAASSSGATQLSTAIGLPPGEERFLPPETMDAFPATSMQTMMLDAYLRDGGRTGAYHCCAIWHVEDSLLDFDKLLAAIQHLHDSHGSLRTSFVEGQDGRILQIVRPRQALTILVDDHLPENRDSRDKVFRDGIAEDIADRFVADGRTPMVRFRIWKESRRACTIMISFHHALLDGWSGVELQNALVSTYVALKTGKSPPSADPGNPTRREFAALEQTGAGDASVRAYLERVAGHRRTTLLRVGRNLAGNGRDFATFTAPVPASAVQAAQETTRRDGVTMKAVFLAALARSLLDQAVLSGPELGVVVNGRSERLTEPLRATGLFWNIVPVLVDRADASPVAMQKQLDAVEALGIFPFSEIRRAFHQEPTFPTFNFVNFHNFRAHEAISLREGMINDRFHFPLNVFVAVEERRRETAAHWRVEFDTSCFDEDRISSLITAANARLKQMAFKQDEQVVP